MRKSVLILISHGKMADEVLKSAEMIVGKIQDAYAVHMSSEKGPIDFNEKLKKIISKTDEKDSIIVMADLLGGTPCNIATMQLKNRFNTSIISGYNLGMVLEYAMARESEFTIVKNQILEAGKSSIQDVLEQL